MKNIQYQPSSKECAIASLPPQPAKKYIPNWFKKVKPVDREKPEFDSEGVQNNTNIKMCMPFLDAFTSGYIQETWTDIYIKVDEDSDGNYKVNIAFPVGPQIASYRMKPTTLEISDEYFPIEFIWLQHWVPIMPDGYSVLFTHPLNRFDLPFISLSGIVDSDVYSHEISGAFPFFLKKEFNGKIIPAGTPMYQIIPIKRESWKSSVNEYDGDLLMKKKHSIRKHIYDGYKNYFWKRKEFI